MDYHINTIGDRQNEMDFFYHCIEFEYNHDFEQSLVEIFYDTLGYDVLDSNVYLYEIDYLELLLFWSG